MVIEVEASQVMVKEEVVYTDLEVMMVDYAEVLKAVELVVMEVRMAEEEPVVMEEKKEAVNNILL